MTTLTRQPSFFDKHKKELLIGGGCLIVGYVVGAVHENYTFQKNLANQIFSNIQAQQERMRESSKKFDESFEKSSKAFDENFKKMRSRFKKD